MKNSEVAPGSTGMEFSHIKVCKRCGLRYDWRKSASSNLKMTYCSSLCEHADLGFTVEAMLRHQSEPLEPSEPVEEPAGSK